VKILIADDDPVSRRLLEATLTRSGHQVVAVPDGASALEALQSPDGPRLAILDWMMPNGNGLDVCRATRRRIGPYVYVILLTSRDRPEDMVVGLDAEADDFLTKPFNAVELGARLRSGERVLHLQERLLRTQDALRYEASHDQLTGLWSRRMILEHLEVALERCRDEALPLTVVLADVDHFKRINDTYGHGVGDVVLRETGSRLGLVLREGERLGRYGGEEFLLVLTDCDLTGGHAAAERLRDAMTASVVSAPGRDFNVTISLGVAGTAGYGLAASALIQAADEALYRAKAQGRNRTVAA
jgi:two-component system, cell cycle response regulator